MPVNKLVSKMITEKYEYLLLTGSFPEVNYRREGYCTSYSLMEYTVNRSKLATIVHEKLTAAGYPDGLFSARLRNEKYLSIARQIIDAITSQQISLVEKRLRTFAD